MNHFHVHPDRYLDLRVPAWERLEKEGLLLFNCGRVTVMTGVPEAIALYLHQNCPALEPQEALSLTTSWQKRYPWAAPPSRDPVGDPHPGGVQPV